MARSTPEIDDGAGRRHESLVETATRRAVEGLQAGHPDLRFSHDRILLKSDINAQIRRAMGSSDPLAGTFLSKDASHIRPDGGLVWLHHGANRRLLGVIEAKKQGTNRTRVSAGKTAQSKGNAIERACKNYLEVCNHQLCEDVFPYLIFVTGCDLDDGSSISDRLTSMTRGGPFNRLTVQKVCGRELASIFLNVAPGAMEAVILRMLNESLALYLRAS